MIMRSHLNRLWVAGIFWLPVLGLTGCSGSSKARLGCLPSQNPSERIEAKIPIENNQKQAQEEKKYTIADISAHISGDIGALTTGTAGAIIGGGAGAIGGGLCAFFTSNDITEGIVNGASGGASWGVYIGAPIGKYTARMTTSTIIWAAPYVAKGLGWLASSAYNGIQYGASALYNGVTGSNQRVANGSCVSDQDADWETLESDDCNRGTELEDLLKPEKCPLGLVISALPAA